MADWAMSALTPPPYLLTCLPTLPHPLITSCGIINMTVKSSRPGILETHCHCNLPFPKMLPIAARWRNRNMSVKGKEGQGRAGGESGLETLKELGFPGRRGYIYRYAPILAFMQCSIPFLELVWWG